MAQGEYPPKSVIPPDPLDDPYLKPSIRTYIHQMNRVARGVELPENHVLPEKNAMFKDWVQRRGRHLLDDYRLAYEPKPSKPKNNKINPRRYN